MKKSSRRAKRMQRHHLRHKGSGGLNLVSLMDIFTILVFFLLVNSSDVQKISTTKGIKLPSSISATQPRDQIMIQVTDKTIFVSDEAVADTVTEAVKPGETIAPLKKKLEAIAKNAVEFTDEEGNPLPKEVMIQADRLVPFKLLRKIISTCAAANYSAISLAVVKKTTIAKN